MGGCGCGFEEPEFAGDDWDKSAASIDALVDWLAPAVTAGAAQMLVCYAGEESRSPTHGALRINEIGSFDFGSDVHHATMLCIEG